jgi:hypothetical protein
MRHDTMPIEKYATYENSCDACRLPEVYGFYFGDCESLPGKNAQ